MSDTGPTIKQQEKCQDAWQGYAHDGNHEDRNTIAVAYVKYAYAIALEHYFYIDPDECRSAAHWLLFKAIREYDATRFSSFAYFLKRRLIWDLRDYFYRDAYCPNRALRLGIKYRELHEDIVDRHAPDAFNHTAVWSAVQAVSPDYQELVVRTIVDGERIGDIAIEKGLSWNTIACKRKAALQAMRTGNRCRRPWTQFVSGSLRKKSAPTHV